MCIPKIIFSQNSLFYGKIIEKRTKSPPFSDLCAYGNSKMSIFMHTEIPIYDLFAYQKYHKASIFDFYAYRNSDLCAYQK